MGTQLAVLEATPGAGKATAELDADQVAAALAAAHPQAAAGVSGFTVRDAFGREGGHGVVVHHIDFDHDGAPAAITTDALKEAIGGYGRTLARAGFHLKGLTRHDGICDAILILGCSR